MQGQRYCVGFWGTGAKREFKFGPQIVARPKLYLFNGRMAPMLKHVGDVHAGEWQGQTQDPLDEKSISPRPFYVSSQSHVQ